MVKIDRKFVEDLTLEERAALVSGKGLWFTSKVPGVKRMNKYDCPLWFRKQYNVAAPNYNNN